MMSSAAERDLEAIRFAVERIADAVERPLQLALGALADIGLNADMTREQMQHKALRVYKEISGKDADA